jgi:hypothetical protein
MNTTTAPSLDPTKVIPRLRKLVIAQSRRRGARAAVLWAVAVAVLTNVALAVAVETVLPKLRDPEYGYRITPLHAHQQAHPDRPLVLMLGTSRVQNSIDPTAMGFPDQPGSPLVFNFGQSAASPLRQWLLLQKLEAEGVRPAAVVIEIFSATLSIPGPDDDEYKRVAAFEHELVRFTYSDISRMESYVDDPLAIRRRWAAERLNTLQTQQPVILSHLAPEWQPWHMRVDHHWNMMDEFGFTAYPTDGAVENRPKRQAKAWDQYGSTLRLVRVSKLTVRVHRDVIAHCRERGIPVAFFVVPESPTFQSWYSQESQKVLAAYLRTLSDELHCPVFTVPAVYGDEDFADGHHMLGPTATRFSLELADRHLKPWLVSCGFKW